LVRICFDEVWNTITTLQGHEFQTKSGTKFQYALENKGISISPEEEKVGHHINENNFFKAYQYMNQYMVSAPDDLDSVARHKGESRVEGASFIWAILNDKRVLERIY
jgi:non-homologous end joining protein Ku